MQIPLKYTTLIPFLRMLKKINKDEKRFAKFLESFKKLELKLPLLKH